MLAIAPPTPARNLAALEKFLSPLTVFDNNLAAAKRYGELREFDCVPGLRLENWA
jgi:hypothetical protein